MAVENPSFEQASLVQGYAYAWIPASEAGLERCGLFNTSGELALTWDYFEAFETGWRSPNLVHLAPDSAYATALAAISITDLAGVSSFITLLSEAHNYHLQAYADPLTKLYPVHAVHDYTNFVRNLAPTTDLSILSIVLNSYLYFFNLHLQLTGVHFKLDHLSYLSLDPLDVPFTDPATIARAEVIQDAVVAHLTRTVSGSSNESSFFDFPSAPDAEEGTFDLATRAYESFEKDWGIPDLYPTDQDLMVTVDAPGVSWPSGHFQFSNHFEYVGSEKTPAETFEEGWMLPGSESLPNDLFFARYYNEDTEVWELVANLVQASAAETFESGWRNNEDCIEDLTERTKSAPAGFQSHVLATYSWTSGSGVFAAQPELVSPQASPYAYLEVTTALGGTGPLGIQVTFKYADSSSGSFIFWADATDKSAGTVLDEVTTTSPVEPTRARTKIYAALLTDVVAITAMSVVHGTMTGTVSVKGWAYPAEIFDTNWTMTLE